MNTRSQKIYQEITNAFQENRRLLAVLLDPDKVDFQQIKFHFFIKVNIVQTIYFFLFNSGFRFILK